MSFAQRTVVHDAGGGRKTELDYDATDRVIQQRILGPDGKLMQKTDYQYLPGHLVAQQTDTAYWPDGKVHKTTQVTYDESANFTGEFIQVFDEAEKQVAGHKLTHNPWNGVYTCADWNAALQAYKSMACPAGEESSGGAEEVKKFTRQDVVQALDAARKTAQLENKTRHMYPMTPLVGPITIAAREVGIVVPAQIRSGERISGIVTEDASKYEEMPEVSVTRVVLPFESAGEVSRLSGWRFETKGAEPQPADGPLTFTAPRGASELSVTLRQAGNPAHSVSTVVHFRQSSGGTRAWQSFKSAALCLKGQLCTVRGPFSGDSTKTFAAFEQRPATIVAETPEAAYISVPDLTEPGARPLFIAEGTKLVALPVVVAGFHIKNNGRELQAGQTLIVFPTLEGPADLPDVLWRAGNYPAANLDRAQKLVPGFRLPREDKDKKEKDAAGKSRETESEKGGEILLVVRNDTPEQISLRESTNQTLVFHLNDESFKMGDFKYDLVVEALKPGPVQVKGYVIPFLAPIPGQEFAAGPSHP